METEEEVDSDTRTEDTRGIMTRRRRRETDAHRQLTGKRYSTFRY